MTLLAPIAAIVAAAAGGSLLLLMYMLRLRRRPVRVSSIMFWGDPPKDLEANVPLRMVRPAWTLLLQALAIALLALALGRPAINADAPSSDRLYILIDQSASMGARDAVGGRTRHEAAQQEALRTIAGVGGLGGARAMVIPFASRAASATPMTSDRGVLAAAVRALAPTDEGGDLGAALKLVAALVASEAGEGAAASAARVILLSDGAFATNAAGNLSGAALEFRPITTAPAGSPPDNLAIAALAAQRDPADPSRVRVFIRLISTRAEPTPVAMLLTVDGQELARRAVLVPAARGTPALGSVEGAAPSAPAAPATAPSPTPGTSSPGEQAISLEFVRAEGGILRAGIDRRDALDSDNSAAVVLPPVRRPTIVVVAPEEPEFFLVSVLQELAPGRVSVLDESTFHSPAGSERLLQADLVVFDRVRPDTLPDAPSLSFGAGLPAPGPDAPPDPSSRQEPTRPTGASQWDRTHPALADVSLDALLVSAPLRLNPRDAGGGTPHTRELASGRDGPLILETRTGANRRIVVAFALRDSNWPISVGFPIFLASAVDYLVYGGDPGRALAFRAGEPISGGTLTGDLSAVSIVATDEQGREAARGTGSLSLAHAGVYTIRTRGADPVPIAVNLGDEFESLLGAADRVAIAGEEVSGVAGAPRPRELWSWFVLAAAIVLAIEWLVYLGVARA